jgi:hypothetical protein
MRSQLLRLMAPALVLVVSFACWYGVSGASQVADAGNAESKELRKQLAELTKQVSELQRPRIVAAGTATWVRPRMQANRTSTRVKLPAEIVAGLGTDYVVVLTSRFPTGGYPYFASYWKSASDGFDITLVDPSLGDGSSSMYVNPNTSYLVDWIVVKK